MAQVPRLLGAAHPLSDQVWDTRAQVFISQDQALQRLLGAQYVLLGEVHNNPDHHYLQARLLSSLVARGRHPAVVFEMFDLEQQASLERSLAQHPGDVSALAQAMALDSRGWPLALYRPILQAALEPGLVLAAGNLSRKEAGRVAASGFAVLGPQWAKFALDALDPPDAAALEQRLLLSHCGYLPQDHAKGMLAAQRARDALLADALLRNAKDGAVLIAGLGHVRTDYAVPLYLRRRAGQAVALSVGFIEVDPARLSVEDYADVGPFDFLWFTRRVQTPDPCEAFKDSLKRLRHGAQRP